MPFKIRREQVISVAQELFYTKGIQAVGMDEICRSAGVSRKTFYGMFESKDAYLTEVIARWDTWIMSNLRQTTDAADSPRASLLAVYDFLQMYFELETFRGCAFMNAFGELGGVSPTVSQLVRDHKSSFHDHIAGLVREAGGPAHLGPQLSILVEGAVTMAAISGNSDLASQARSAAVLLIDAALAD